MAIVSPDHLQSLRHDLARLGVSARLGAAQTHAPASLPPNRGIAVHPLFAAGQVFGGLHEIVAATPRDLFTAWGFAVDFAAACAQVRSHAGIVLIAEDFVAWEAGALYGPGLAAAGLDPARLLVVSTHDPRETMLAMELALRSRAVAGVLAESAISPKLYDLATSRRLLLAARTGGSAALFVPRALCGQAARMSSAATARFEIARTPSRAIPFGRSRTPMPGRPAFSFRLVKAPGGLTDAAARTREQWRDGVFGVPLDEAAFHAFSFDPSAFLADRPDSSPREAGPSDDLKRIA